jgi:hypothetical protein
MGILGGTAASSLVFGSFALWKEATDSSETLISVYQTKCFQIPEENNLEKETLLSKLKSKYEDNIKMDLNK